MRYTTRFFSRTCRRLASERGSHLVEVAVGMLVLSVVVIGLMASMTSGMMLVARSRQRSAAVAVAQEYLERVRSLPYERIALQDAPAHSADPDHPDSAITEDNGFYRVGDDATEALVVDLERGALKHAEATTVGKTALSIHQFVTWVDDATIAGGQNYKRVTVVANAALGRLGRPANAVQSTVVADSTVTVPEGTLPPAESGTPGQAAPSALPPSCAGDTQAPAGSIEVISDAASEQNFTNSPSIQIRLQVTDACPHVIAELSNDGTTYTEVATHADPQSITVAWSIPAGDGSKTVYGRFRDAAGNTSTTLVDQVVLDSTLPAVPGNLRVLSCSLSGSDRAVMFAWDASMDANLLGYRLLRSVESERFVDVATTTTGSASDTVRKSHGSVRYLVRSYDKVGNVSADSNVLSFSRGGC